MRLEPVSLAHVPALWRAGAYEAIWRYLPYTMHSEADMRARVEADLAEQQAGEAAGVGHGREYGVR